MRHVVPRLTEHAAVGGDRIRIARALSYGRSGRRCCWRVRIPDGERHVTGVVDADKVTLFDTGKANTRTRYHGDWGLTFGDNRQRFRRRINGLDTTSVVKLRPSARRWRSLCNNWRCKHSIVAARESKRILLPQMLQMYDCRVVCGT